MKNFLKVILVCFIFITAFCINTQKSYSFDLQPLNYIQNNPQKVVLISSNPNSLEFLSNSENKDLRFFSNDNHKCSQPFTFNECGCQKTLNTCIKNDLKIKTLLNRDSKIRAP